MYRVFKNIEDYSAYTNNGQKLTSGDLYIVTDDKKVILQTNNIDGEFAVYDMIEPTGSIEITENGEDIDIASYSTATVNVPQPSGNIEITENGEDINIAQYATATVNVESGNPLFSQFIDGSFTTFDIPEGTTDIGYGAFRECTSLEEVTIPNSVTGIGHEAFNGCTRLTSVTIPDSVTAIGYDAFNGCTGLTSIVVDSANTAYDSRNNCNALIKTSTNELITGCKNTIIPNTVTSIGEFAFKGCSGLTSVTIPNSVTSISNYAFNGCSGLTSVTINATTPPTIGASTFTNTNNCPIYVPAASVSAYKGATNWNSLSSRIQAIPA